MSLSDVLESAAKKVRKPKPETPEATAGENAPVEKPVRVRKPKMVQAVNEDGTPQVDAEGNPVMIEAPKAEKKVREPRLDAEGNPLPRRSNVFLDSQVLKLTDKGIATQYRAGTKRGDIFASIKDGMTVGEFYELNGGKSVSHTFLVWYVNEAEVVTVE